jgi:prophage DNA circulation protein
MRNHLVKASFRGVLFIEFRENRLTGLEVERGT